MKKYAALLLLSVNSVYSQVTFSEMNDMGDGEIVFELKGTAQTDIYSYFVDSSGIVDPNSESITTVSSYPACLGQDSLNFSGNEKFGMILAKDTNGDQVADTLMDFVSVRGKITVAPLPINSAVFQRKIAVNIGNESAIPTKAFRKKGCRWQGPVSSVCNPPVHLNDCSGRYDSTRRQTRLEWSTRTQSHGGTFEIWRKLKNSHWTYLSSVSEDAPSSGTQNYMFDDQTPDEGHVFYRVTYVNGVGERVISKGVHVQTKHDDFFPENPALNGKITVQVQSPVDRLELVSMNGDLIQSWSNLMMGSNVLTIQRVPPIGAYYLRSPLDYKVVILGR